MKQLLKEPLVHFIVLGALLFAGYRLVNREPQAGPADIVVSPGQIEHMITFFARTWQRPPSDEEMKGLVDQYVREEVFSREAMKLGLDQNDVIIRRRLQQKMEFIANDVAAAEPTEKELADYMAKHPKAFREDTTLTFGQIYLSPDKRGAGLEADAARLLAELKLKGAQADVSALGDPTLLPLALADKPARGVEEVFGTEFASAAFKLTVGEWSGPVRSSFGLHLVFVESHREGGVPPLADVREVVQREWANARRLDANRKLLDELLKNYRVTIQWPKPEATEKKLAEARP
ncbi:MAG: peptidyl-prolyl cis-trans isomerase [Verrucomicrobiales bacterium]|nr:peptidyl-prolyl cis-trans isomerase [Verrucomicrobiales bacterium]